jgi:four helix bundle protein
LKEVRCDLAKGRLNKENIGERNGMQAASIVPMPIETYRDLETWQACMDVLVETYQLTRKLPGCERFGLTSQMQRASVSMPSNVAEGWARSSTLVYINHVDIAIGSHAELETCAEAARRLHFVSDDEFWRYMAPLDRAGQLLNGSLRSLKAKEK